MELDSRHTRGAFSFLNPTHARLNPTAKHLSSIKTPSDETSEEEEHHPTTTQSHSSEERQPSESHLSPFEKKQKEKQQQQQQQQPATAVAYQWRSRDNRKGRHTLVVTPPSSSSTEEAKYLAPPSTSTLRAVAHGILRMFVYYPYWDVSWWVAVMFTLGSVVWVFNAFFVWLPLADPATEFPNESIVAGGWTAFIGATIFELGSILLMIEAVNENRSGCFGWALEQVLDDEKARWSISASPSSQHCTHHHTNRKNFVSNNATESSSKTTWQWLPTWHDLHTHYLHELGFLACLFQYLGPTIFWISGFTALPQIQSLLPTQSAINGAYWIPQIIGGSGFIISSFCFMLETQPKWYIPSWRVLGWWIGLWNLVGALGFTLCGALGLVFASPDAQYQANLATFWGSWAFLIGSVLQWYESLDTHPVEVQKVQKVQTGQKGGGGGDDDDDVGVERGGKQQMME